MTDTGKQAADFILQGYETELVAVRLSASTLIAELTAEVEMAGEDAVSDFFYDQSEATKGNLGAYAANRVEGEQEQNEAMAVVERWVAENVANAGWEANVANVIWANGPEEAGRLVRMETGGRLSPTA